MPFPVEIPVAAMLLASAMVACQAHADQPGRVRPSVQERAANQLTLGYRPPTVKTSRAQLAKLTVAPPGSMKGYAREKFPHWNDASAHGWPEEPDNSCTSRNAALWRDGKKVKVNARCTVTSGTWLDPYTAKTYRSKSDMDIDHMVPLANAWRSGASAWPAARRTQFANAPLVLVSVQDKANQSKGDKSPDLWKPANKQVWCLYAKRWTTVKAAYGLSVTAPEKKALSAMLDGCAA